MQAGKVALARQLASALQVAEVGLASYLPAHLLKVAADARGPLIERGWWPRPEPKGSGPADDGPGDPRRGGQ